MKSILNYIILLIACLVLTSCSSKEELLFEALHAKDYNGAQEVIKSGVDVNQRDKNGFTPIFFSNDVATAQLLIAHGADVNITGGGVCPNASNTSGRRYEYSPLHIIKNPAAAALIIAHDADVNVRTCYGKTPLHKARSYFLMEVLLSHGADVNARCNYNRTPLNDLVKDHPEGGGKMVELLIEFGADPNLADNLGHTPLHSVAWEKILHWQKFYCAMVLIYGEKVRLVIAPCATPFPITRWSWSNCIFAMVPIFL